MQPYIVVRGNSAHLEVSNALLKRALERPPGGSIGTSVVNGREPIDHNRIRKGPRVRVRRVVTRKCDVSRVSQSGYCRNESKWRPAGICPCHSDDLSIWTVYTVRVRPVCSNPNHGR